MSTGPTATSEGLEVPVAPDVAATKPFGFMRFTPGPGVGGHCLPIVPSYLYWHVQETLGYPFRFVELANDINEHMSEFVVERALGHFNEREMSVKGGVFCCSGWPTRRTLAMRERVQVSAYRSCWWTVVHRCRLPTRMSARISPLPG